MAVVNVKAMWSNVNSEKEQLSGLNAARWSASKGYTVLFDSVSNDNSIIAQTAAGIPALDTQYSATYTWLLCRRIRVLNPTAPTLYTVVCEFWGKQSPLTEDARKSWSRVSERSEAAQDINGVPYLNPNYEKMYGVTRLFVDRVYNFSRNEATDAFAYSSSYSNSVNSDIITLNGHAIAAGRAMMGLIEAERVVDIGAYYWNVRYPVHIREDAPYWRQKFICRGEAYRPTAGAGLRRVKDLNGLQWNLLKADGTILPLGDPIEYLYFDEFKSVAWAPLGLG